MCSQKECPTKFETRWLQEIPLDVIFPGNIDAMFPGNIDGMFPGNMNSEGNCNYYCMSRETISTNHVAVFYVEM